MKIAQIVKTPQRRGAEIFALELSEELERRGHETAIFYLYRHSGAGALALRPRDRILGEGDSVLERVPGAQPALVRRLLRALDAFGPDVVQVNGSRTVKYGSLARRMRPGRWPLIGRVIGSPADWAGGAIKRTLYARLVLSALDGVIAVSSGTLDGLRRCYNLDVASAIIPRGIDPSTVRPETSPAVVRIRWGTPVDALVLLYVGSLTAEKRLDRLLRAFARVRCKLPRSRLWIAGEGPEAPLVDRLIDEFWLKHSARRLGVLDCMGDVYGAADLLVLTSDTEGTPGVLLEAGMAGLPAVATRVGGVADCVRHGKTGLLVDRDDEEGLESAIISLLNDTALRKALGGEAHRWIRSQFSLDRVSDQIVSFYRRLVDAPVEEDPLTDR